MQLSYTWRLICLALCSGGLLQLLLEWLAWMAAPLLLRQTAGQSARSIERTLFSLALFARLSPWLVVLAAWVPAYMRGEDNLASERVGWICLAGAAGVAVRLLFCWARVLRAWLVTERCCRFCREVGRSPDGLPVLLYPGERSLLAVVGVFRARVLISQSLLVSGRFPAATLDIAFRHEEAHARQRDNLKFMLLSLLPHAPLAMRTRRSLGQQWRLAAEMAADEDGAMGRSERSVLLADMLVTLARNSGEHTLRVAFALFSQAEDLRERVDRLLRNSSATGSGAHAGRAVGAHLQTGCVALLSAGLFATLCYGCLQAGHRAAELLLHLG